MQILIKRNDKIPGFSGVVVTTKAYPSDSTSPIEKGLSNGGHTSFTIRSESVDIICSVGDVVVKEWRGLRSDKKITLEFWLKKSHTHIAGYVPDLHGKNQNHDTSKPWDTSQIIDRKKQFIGLGLFALSMIFGMAGLFVLKVDGPAPLGWGLLLVAVVGFVYALIKHGESGVNDARCEKCNSNKLVVVDRDEAFMGTYSKQEEVYDYKSGKYEYARVIKSDFAVTERCKCQVCDNSWVNNYTRTTDSN